MNNNPQLHYLNHVQNTSISKHCCRFAKAPRFNSHTNTSTDFKYDPKAASKSRCCSFGYGQRSSLSAKKQCPSPNQYNISKFPLNLRSTTIGFSRQDASFGTIAVEIKQKAKLPAPGAYESESSINRRKFTLRKRLLTDIEIKAKQRVPGPGQYKPIQINKQGKYPISTVKNVRYVFVDSYKQQSRPKLSKTGPGSYEIQNTTSNFSCDKIQRMKTSTCKPFGTQKRRGPEQMHRIFVPGPGMYETFSSFGDRKLTKLRSKTQY